MGIINLTEEQIPYCKQIAISAGSQWDNCHLLDGNTLHVDDVSNISLQTALSNLKFEELQQNNKWEKIKEQRKKLLLETDWVGLFDVPLTDEKRTLWREYRQALRDIPQKFNKPNEVIWPVKPE